eukprot:TRINITY_DN39493_c1_g1_i1.p1 TRINITY_DN39493_c1_g1~~TRINITY_DN39493_c1_g1_i1.p1  ORF type:complete len:362 (+),score=52.71 TRINITY_DN39493_c1_g1_i1:102-1187(+)
MATVLAASSSGDRAERTLRFLAEAAHLYALLAPATSRCMVSQMRAKARASGIEIHSSIAQRYCECCSQIRIPGSTCRVEIANASTHEHRNRRRRRQSRHALSSLQAGTAMASVETQRANAARLCGGRSSAGAVSADRSTSGGRRTGLGAAKARKKLVRSRCSVCGKAQVLHRVSRPAVVSTVAAAAASTSVREGLRAAAREEARLAAAAAKRARKARSGSSSAVAPRMQLAENAANAKISDDHHTIPLERSKPAKASDCIPVGPSISNPGPGLPFAESLAEAGRGLRTTSLDAETRAAGGGGGETCIGVQAKKRRRQGDKMQQALVALGSSGVLAGSNGSCASGPGRATKGSTDPFSKLGF